MRINFNLLRSFRKNLKTLKIAKRDLERELMSLRVEIQEHELAIQYIERNIQKESKVANLRKKNKSRSFK